MGPSLCEGGHLATVEIGTSYSCDRNLLGEGIARPMFQSTAEVDPLRTVTAPDSRRSANESSRHPSKLIPDAARTVIET